jgi:alpha-L-fucosidase
MTTDFSAAPQNPTQLRFEPTWESLKQYRTPDWFRDAKFGIYTHWGPMSAVPGHRGWYGRHMYMQEGAEWEGDYETHLRHFGHPSEFGYKDIIPLWTAENWDPDWLISLFKHAGARYFGAVAVHHDNFDAYDSTHQPWNSVNMGPKRDIVGEWKAAAVKHGLRFGVASHSDRSWSWFAPSFGADVKGPLEGVPYDGNLTKADGAGKWWNGYDPQDLYPLPHGPDEPADAAYVERWFKRTQELIEKYEPDLLYFDGPIPLVGVGDSGKTEDGRPLFEQPGMEIAAQFYNASLARHGGTLEAVLNIKRWGPDSVVYPGAVVMDTEKGVVDRLNPLPWQTDTSLAGTWFYNDDGKSELTAEVVVHNLCDIVSKNGNMMLNVALRADGTLPENERAILESVGGWLRVNGEAIYGTRPWMRFGEGPSRLAVGEFKQNTSPLTAQDIRFTQRDGKLYAIFMAWPEDGRLRIHSITTARSIKLIGSGATLVWENSLNGVIVQLPAEPVGSMAYALRIEGHQSLLARPNLVAWCLVPYDAKQRGPAERMAMLSRLGFDQYVWDWREQHLAELPEEIKASREAGISLRGAWLWIDERSDRPGALSEANRTVLNHARAAHLPLEFWVGFNANFFDGIPMDQRVAKGAAMVAYLSEQVARTGGTLALYNHGDWFGQPENQLAILDAVGDSTIGMVYNFHHELAQREQFGHSLQRMLPRLRAVNLTGLPSGKAGVFPLGSGEGERETLQLLIDAGFTGSLGILAHVEDADAEAILRANLEGFRGLAEALVP